MPQHKRQQQLQQHFTDLLKAAPCTVNIHHQTNQQW